MKCAALELPPTRLPFSTYACVKLCHVSYWQCRGHSFLLLVLSKDNVLQPQWLGDSRSHTPAAPLQPRPAARRVAFSAAPSPAPCLGHPCQTPGTSPRDSTLASFPASAAASPLSARAAQLSETGCSPVSADSDRGDDGGASCMRSSDRSLHPSIQIR